MPSKKIKAPCFSVQTARERIARAKTSKKGFPSHLVPPLQSSNNKKAKERKESFDFFLFFIFLHHGVAVNTDDLAVDPATILRSEEAEDASDIEGLTDASKRGPGSGILVDLVVGEVGSTGDVLTADGVVHVGLDATRGNAVDSDLLVASI